MRVCRWFPGAVVLFFLAACQTPKPTLIRETSAPVEDPATYAARLLAEKPVILDVRSDIDFGMSHVPGSVNVHWEDLNSVSTKEKGLLETDRFALARRFALWGVDPRTTVLILGLGPEGRGEEGRVGWALKILGVPKVETASIRLFTPQNPRDGETRPANKPVWKPETKNDLEIKPDEFKRLAFQGWTPPTKARRQALQGASHLWVPPARIILDVSHPNERDVKSIEDMKPAWKVVRSSWRKFYDEHGRGSCTQAVAELSKESITAQHEILVVDGDGVGAAAVGFVLDSCRFGKPRVLSSGLRGLGRLK